MKRKCDHCEQPATHHMVEILDGQKVEKHLCDEHANEAGVGGKPMDASYSQVLSQFAKKKSQAKQDGAVCEHCGMTYRKFRDKSLLGCPECYKAFVKRLVPLMERAHEGGSHHVGKVPRRAGSGEHRQAQLTRMRGRLEEALTAEDYELAARLRDDIRTLEHDA